ncbi:MAG TPA: LEPR-XLL domain-containing protein, partial [Phycisphaerales bacterium]|nr:LEPR-XLL domain-containing protein [Phycisphaerales bacterium]
MPFTFEQIEPRLMLAGDHPSLPATWGPFPPGPTADTIALDNASALTNPARGSGSVNGTIAAGDDGDLFKFVMPSTGGRTKDFVSVLADTTAAASTLDTFVEVYDQNGNLLVSGANNSNGFAGTVSVGLNSLLPVASRAPDGWAGFEGTAGQTYY